MLVLSRRLGQSVVIDGHIRVTVVEIHHGKIRLGIEAPKSIPVYRSELLPADLAERQAETREGTP